VTELPFFMKAWQMQDFYHEQSLSLLCCILKTSINSLFPYGPCIRTVLEIKYCRLHYHTTTGTLPAPGREKCMTSFIKYLLLFIQDLPLTALSQNISIP